MRLAHHLLNGVLSTLNAAAVDEFELELNR